MKKYTINKKKISGRSYITPFANENENVRVCFEDLKVRAVKRFFLVWVYKNKILNLNLSFV